MSIKKYAKYLIIAALFAAFVLFKIEIAHGNGGISEDLEENNLLVNGSMEDGFDWKYPSHHIAKGWKRWWTMDSPIPEYDDVRPWRSFRYDGEHAQLYHWIWPQAYTAGIYQQVDVQPCTFYQFSMYGRNVSYHETDHHARIGIDPWGRKLGLYLSSFFTDIAWSSEQTYFNTWGQHIVATETYTDHLTAITYVSPDHGYAPYETFWDAGTLLETLPPDGRLPAAESMGGDGFITNVNASILLDFLVIEWDTLEPASTQVWYSILDTSPLTPTAAYTESVIYLPAVFNDYGTVPDFQYFTPVDQTPVTHHRVLVESLEDGQTVQFIALSRRLDGSECRTSSSDVMKKTLHIDPVFRLYLPLVVR